MEFSIDGFTQAIRDNLYDNFPYMDKPYMSSWGVLQTKEQKNPNRPLHIRDIAFGYLPTFNSGDQLYFDIGSDYAEEYYPYYHILNDAQVIHKRNKATKSSKGSQDKISKKSARDYGIINWNGKTFSREYQKNVRGARSRTSTATKKLVIVDSEGVVHKVKENEGADYYVNIHYKYIDRILDATIPFVAHEFGLTLKRKEDSGLAEEYAQQEETNLVNAIMSMMEE